MWTSAEGMYSVNAYVKNLADNRYKTGGTGGCGANGCTGTTTATIANPRSFGVTANVRF
jgi:outer membrane receptor protein involved in Fe transport